MSLNNLSLRLSDLGHREDALAAIQEAVELSRKLAADRPAAFNANLATSLNNLSLRLFDLGRQEDALAAIQEAVEFHRKLAAD
jgi:tetratricopeptide (TPR) repeat protein